MENSIPQRYELNPMLAIVENYVLDAIGKLEPDQAAKLNQIVNRTFGGTDWKKTIRAQLQLPADTHETINHMWKQRQEEASAKQEELTPEDFARQMADDLFADMGE